MDVLGLLSFRGWILLIIGLSTVLYIYVKRKFGLWRRLGIPGPDHVPYVGQMIQLNKKGFYALDVELVQKYGRLVGLYFGSQPSIMISDPDLIKTIMVKDFSKAPNRFALVEQRGELRQSLTEVADDHWRFMRNTILPTFSSGKLRKMGFLLKEKYKMLLEGLTKKAEQGNVIEFKQVFGSYTMDVIASLGFGMEIDSQTNPDNKFVKYAKELFEVDISLLAILAVLIPPFDKLLDYFSLSPLNNRRRMEFFKSAVHQAIDMRDDTDKDRKDMLQLMLNAHNYTDKNEIEDKHAYENPEEWKKRGLTVDEITGNSILFLLAGYDTTASTMTFIAYNLATNPECQDKLINEIDTVLEQELPTYDNIQKLEYLDKVFNETLRLYPPAVRTNRNNSEEIDVEGVKIPPNTEIIFPIFAIHRNPKYWPEPEKFDPERFTQENKESRHPYTFLPFGHGPRNCIGQRLAGMEVKCGIAYILQHYRFTKCSETEINLKYVKWKFGLWRRLGIPGPDFVPYVGQMIQLNKKGFHGLDVELVQKYGNLVGLYFGSQPSIMISDPDLIKSIMVKDFSKAPNRFSLVEQRSELKHSLTEVVDDHWRFIRNTILPTFSSGKLRHMGFLLKEKYKMLLEGLTKNVEQGNVIEFKQVFENYTMDAIASLGFGMEIDCQTNPENMFVKHAKEVIGVNISPFFILAVLFPPLDKLLDYFKISPLNNRNKMEFFKSVVHRAIDMRDNTDRDRKDMLQLMLNAHKLTDKNEIEDSQAYENPEEWKKRGLTIEEITGNSILFLMAGYETTASTMTFIAYNLATNQECQDKLLNEIDTVLKQELPTYDNIQKLEYLDKVFNETLRLYPPAVRSNRINSKEIDVDGVKIPPKTELIFPIFAIHRNPKHWPEPEKFDPERFTSKNKESRHPYTFLPFGHGPRNCIGQRLAGMEAKCGITYILQHYRFAKCSETEIPLQLRKNGLLKPANDVKLKLEKRIPTHLNSEI
ncbi:cytochrome P450 3A9-like [Saccostrea echinata]|uniref:cytochrome P450 3A9-like n=1 Tax=Saccostrea echinata TaxID=191078 RepID=UPI002A7FC804|nr:cytochrome P450 3A9-like [Saccostrea echinata]